MKYVLLFLYLLMCLAVACLGWITYQVFIENQTIMIKLFVCFVDLCMFTSLIFTGMSIFTDWRNQ